jgi:pimeloyl-ACP methyl ester carboxylesterase
MLQPISMKRAFWRVAIVVLTLYLLACIALYMLQRTLLYYPQPMLAAPDAQGISIPANGNTLRGWIVDPGQPEAILYFGGNGERVERNVGFFRAAMPGYSVYLVPYRGYGPNAGEPTEAGLYADALAEYAWVHARNAHVSVMGRSLGTGVATYLASKRAVEKLVLVTPYDSIVNLAQARYPIFPVSWLMKDRYESWRRAGSIKARVLVLLADGDEVVPRTNSDALIASFHPKPEVVVVAHAGHDNLTRSATYTQAIEGFMRVPAAMPPAIRVPQR